MVINVEMVVPSNITKYNIVFFEVFKYFVEETGVWIRKWIINHFEQAITNTGWCIKRKMFRTEFADSAPLKFRTASMKINCGGLSGSSVRVGSSSRPRLYASRRIKPAGWFTTFLRLQWCTRLWILRVLYLQQEQYLYTYSNRNLILKNT